MDGVCNMGQNEYLLEHYRKLAGVSEEEHERLLEEERAKNPVPLLRTDLENIGEAMIITFQNDNQLGELVMSLFLQVNDMAMVVMQLQSELEELKNA
jgi:hypothetical protein